jgi:hypothetical protein
MTIRMAGSRYKKQPSMDINQLSNFYWRKEQMCETPTRMGGQHYILHQRMDINQLSNFYLRKK